jgi:hypothetical protein
LPKVDKKSCQKVVKKVVKKLSKFAKKLPKNCQKLPKSCQNLVAPGNNTVTDFLSRYHGLGAEDKKTEAREYSSKHQGLEVAQVDASAPRIRALQLLDNNLEPMIRHKPNAKEYRVVEDQLKPTNMKRQIPHVQNGIVYITNQTRRGFIDDPDN